MKQNNIVSEEAACKKIPLQKVEKLNRRSSIVSLIIIEQLLICSHVLVDPQCPN